MNSNSSLQDRKSFFKTLGFLGVSTLLSKKLNAFSALDHNNVTLIPAGDSHKPLRIAHLTDIHVFPGKVPEYGMAKVLEEVNNNNQKIDFIINGGDAILNKCSISKSIIKQQWNTFNNIFENQNSLECYHCIGNHDLYSFAIPDNNHLESKKWALDEYKMAKPYYSFNKKGWKFIVLDSIHGRSSVPGYYGKLDEEQFNWLETELRITPSDTFICIVSHIPILAICTIFDGNNHSNKLWSVPDNCLHADATALTKLFYKYKNIKVCLSGHIHLIDHVNYQGIDYYCNGAVSGSWWNGSYNDCDPAYAIMNFYNDGSCKRELNYYSWSK